MKALNTISFIAVLLLSINTFAQTQLAPPENVQASVIDTDVMLSWQEPDTINNFFISWDNGITGNSIGLTSGGTFAVAARWQPDFLAAYDNYSITKLDFYMPDETTIFNIKIWQGQNADTVVYSFNNANGNLNDWTSFILNTPININTAQTLWVGYEVIQPSGVFPAGCDFGPAISGSGDMINFDGSWISMSSAFGLDFNFNIRAYLQNDAGSFAMLNSGKASSFPYNNQDENIIESKVHSIESTKSVNTLLGYNVYKDNALLNSVPINDTLLVDPGVDPGVYNYGVSAVYQEGESNQAMVGVQIGNPDMVISPTQLIDTLPVNQFATYVITIENQGDIELNWFGQLQDFWAFLYPNAGVVQPGEAIDVTLEVGTYYFSSGTYTDTISFFQNNPENPVITFPITIVVSGDPFIQVQPDQLSFGDVTYESTNVMGFSIFNNGTDTLNINSITSNNPEFEVLPYNTNIPAYHQEYIQVQFSATTLGENTGELTILSNASNDPEFTLPLSANVFLPGPVFLQSEIIDNDVTLSWDMEVSGNGDWISWDNGENFTSLGLTGGGSFEYAARWDAGQLINYDGNIISKIAFFPVGENSNFIAKIWSGPNASNLLISQVVNAYNANIWNDIILQAPVVLDASQELWVGFEVIHPDGEFPAGADGGPAIQNYGDMLNFGGAWASLAGAYGLDMNWNIQAFISTGDSTFKSITSGTPLASPKEFLNTGEIELSKDQSTSNASFFPMAPMADVIGYNVYKDNAQINDDLVTELTYTDLDVELGFYTYGVTAVYTEGESPQTQIQVQIGAPEILLDPVAISDTLETSEIITYDVLIANNGTIDLDWIATANGNWLSFSPASASITPGDSLIAELTVNPFGLFAGTYSGSILFEINNLNNPVEILPVTISIDGDAQLVFAQDSINFGLTAVGTTKTAYATLSNIGNDFVYITGMTASPGEFETQSFPLYLGPGGSISWPVSFTPPAEGNYLGTLEVETDSLQNLNVEVPLIGTSLLPAPINFTAVIDSIDVMLDWENPVGTENTLQYSDEISATAIGYSSGGIFNVAAKFGPSQLIMYNGGTISEIGFYPWTSNANFTIRVWLGENAETLVVDQAVSSVAPLEWNDILLDTPIAIDTSSYIWIGYQVDHEAGEFPAGTDLGPAIQGMSDLISIDGTTWENLTDYGLFYSWNIRGLVNMEDTKSSIASQQVFPQNTYENTGFIKLAFEPETSNFKQSNLMPLLTGYNIYRDGTILNDPNVLTESSYIDSNLVNGIYSYEVTAVYDIGESLPAGPLEIVIEDPVLFPEGWTPVPTSMTHVIHIPTSAETTGLMSAGDLIGVFHSDNGTLKPAGALYWTESDSLKLIAYGNDPATPEKEGFDFGEWIYWKVHMHETGDEFLIDVAYNDAMPQHDGLFWMLGMSALAGMEITFTGIENNGTTEVKIYPNPSNGLLNIVSDKNIGAVDIYNMSGAKVYEISNLNNKFINRNIQLDKGIYYLIIKHEQAEVRKKLIIN